MINAKEEFSGNFTNDPEKMRDFFALDEDRFLQSYSYLTKAEYDATANALLYMIDGVEKRFDLYKIVVKVSEHISNVIYKDNMDAVIQLIKLLDTLAETFPKRFAKPETWEDYVRMYDENFFTYKSFEELVKSEADNSDGLTEEECKTQIGETIWKLPCGWYVQYV